MATATRGKGKTDAITAGGGGTARPTTRIGRMATSVARKSKALATNSEELAAGAEELAGACLAAGVPATPPAAAGGTAPAAKRGRKRSG